MNEYRCLDCGAEFATGQQMNDHIDNFHNEGYGDLDPYDEYPVDLDEPEPF